MENNLRTMSPVFVLSEGIALYSIENNLNCIAIIQSVENLRDRVADEDDDG